MHNRLPLLKQTRSKKYNYCFHNYMCIRSGSLFCRYVVTCGIIAYSHLFIYRSPHEVDTATDTVVKTPSDIKIAINYMYVIYNIGSFILSPLSLS